jgi:hypothetical protein
MARQSLILAIWPTINPTAPGSRGDNDGLTRRRPADFEKPDVGGHPGHAQDTERGRDWRRRWVEPAQPGAVRNREVLPAAIAQHDVPDRIVGVARRDVSATVPPTIGSPISEGALYATLERSRDGLVLGPDARRQVGERAAGQCNVAPPLATRVQLAPQGIRRRANQTGKLTSKPHEPI